MLIVLKLKATAIGAAVIAPLLTASLAPPTASTVDGTVSLPASSFSYRIAGDFSRDGKPVAAPLRNIHPAGDLAIMKSQVTAAAYARSPSRTRAQPSGSPSKLLTKDFPPRHARGGNHLSAMRTSWGQA